VNNLNGFLEKIFGPFFNPHILQRQSIAGQYFTIVCNYLKNPLFSAFFVKKSRFNVSLGNLQMTNKQ